MIVVKVGGSLYDHPRLGPGLRTYLNTQAKQPVMIVPGGGVFADAVRKCDKIHQLGENASHWIALRSLSVAFEFLRAIVDDNMYGILDPFTFDDDTLPHSWAVTSDSIAARAAVVYRATRLVLLKSVDIQPDTPWPEAAEKKWVDPHFPQVVKDAPFPIEVINFRRWLDDSAPSSTRVL